MKLLQIWMMPIPSWLHRYFSLNCLKPHKIQQKVNIFPQITDIWISHNQNKIVSLHKHLHLKLMTQPQLLLLYQHLMLDNGKLPWMLNINP